MEVVIGDAYDVVDKGGKVNSYSLGYYVGKKPYGYAIYDIDKSSIREFVFQEDVKNLYVELEENAKLDSNVNEDSLIDSIVYDEGIDYSVCDKSGNGTSVLEQSGTNVVLEQGELDTIVSEKKHSKLKFSGIYNNKNIFELCGDEAKKWYDIQNTESVSGYNVIKDCGLAMISQGYYTNNLKKYCCVVSSVTGSLNWMGRLYNGNILDTYNKFWKDCKVDSEMDNGILSGGSSCYLAADALNKYFKSIGITTTAKATSNVTFNKCVQSIDCTYDKEGSPFIFDVGRKDSLEGHSVIGVSYYKTAGHNYLGIFNNWFLDNNDSNYSNQYSVGGISTATSTYSVRYIDFDELKNSNKWEMDATFLSDVRSANIKEPKTEYVSSNNIELSCYVPYGTKYVYFPTWTDGKQDVIWHKGTIDYGTYATVSIDMSKYNNKNGVYDTHIYAYDGNMNVLAMEQYILLLVT